MRGKKEVGRIMVKLDEINSAVALKKVVSLYNKCLILIAT